MKLDWQTHNEVIVIKVLEDILSNPEMIRDFESALTCAINTHRKVLLDLSKVIFMNSYAIRALLVGNELANSAHVRFCLCGLKPELSATFRVLKIADLIPPYANRGEALDEM